MDKYIQQFANLANQITQKIFALAPQAWQALLKIEQFQGMQYIAYGILDLVAGLLGLVLTIIYTPKLWKWAEGNEASSFRADGGYFFLAFLIIAAIIVATTIFLFSAIGWLSNIWNWIMVFHPDIAIAHDLYVKVFTK